MAGQGCDSCWQEVWEEDSWPPVCELRPHSSPPFVPAPNPNLPRGQTELGESLGLERADWESGACKRDANDM